MNTLATRKYGDLTLDEIESVTHRKYVLDLVARVRELEAVLQKIRNRSPNHPCSDPTCHSTVCVEAREIDAVLPESKPTPTWVEA